MRAAPQWVDVPGALRLDRATLPEVADRSSRSISANGSRLTELECVLI